MRAMKRLALAGLLGVLGVGAASCTSVLGGFDFEGNTASSSGAGGKGSTSSGNATSVGSGGTGGGDSSTSGSTSSTGATGSTGSTGSGGSPPVTGSCTDVGAIFTIFENTDFSDPADQIDDQPLLVPDHASTGGLVHVIIRDDSTGETLVRSVANNATQPLVGSVSRLANFDSSSAWAEASPGALHVAGANRPAGGALAIGEQTFAVTPAQGANSPSFHEYSTPSDCLLTNAYAGSIVAIPAAGGVRFVASCRFPDPNNTQGTLSSLWGWHTNDGPATKIASGNEADPLMNPRLYAYSGGMHFMTGQDDKNGTIFAYGTNLSDLAQPHDVALTPGGRTFFTDLQPLPAGQSGVALFAIDVDATFMHANLVAGAVTTSQYPTLVTNAPSLLPTFYTPTDTTSVSIISNSQADDTTIISAGATGDGIAVQLTWTLRNTTPIVLEKTVYTASTTTVVAAAAAPLENLKLVAWSEQDSAGHVTVRGKRMSCVMN